MRHSTSLFAQILDLINENSFRQAVRQTQAEKGAKGFTCWNQCVSMLFCQLAQCKSLREISDGLKVTCGKINHLGLKAAPAKSTLSYANAHRPAQLFENLFYQMLKVCQSQSFGRKKAFRFKNRLFSLDSTVFDLCLSLFPWAQFRQTKGAVKLHLLLDHDGYLPTFANITQGRVHDVKVAQMLTFPRGSIIACDRGYFDLALFDRWTSQGVFFVTRIKDNICYDVVERFEVPENSPVLYDHTIQLKNRKYPGKLRLVTVYDDIRQCELEILTNNFILSSATIAAIYKDRWQIELFFKCIKQNLKIKTFVGTTPNALKIQIWTALIAILLLKLLQYRSRMKFALSRFVALLRLSLFSYRNLQDWLDDPFEVPPEEPPLQLSLVFGTASGTPGAGNG